MVPLQDATLSPGSLLLIEHVEVTSAAACGRPYVLMHEDGRLVGRVTTVLTGIDLPRPPSFPKWAEWSARVHGVCGLNGLDRNAVTGPVEALNEERFFLSELYMTVAQLVRSQEDDGSHYRLRMWQAQIAAHIPPAILHSIRHGSVVQCLKQHYMQCPLIKARPDRPFANLCIHLPAVTAKTESATDLSSLHLAVTVSGKRISHICHPHPNPVFPHQGPGLGLGVGQGQGPGTIDAFFDNLIQSTENGIDFDEFFKRIPIRFHRDRFALR